MGAWGLKTFENDDAGDWVFDLEETSDLSLVESTLFGWSADYLESPDVSCILAAVEIVKALQKGIDEDLPEDVKKWVFKHQHLDATNLVSQAVRSIDRILGEESELKELWEETNEYDHWVADVKKIKVTLQDV